MVRSGPVAGIDVKTGAIRCRVAPFILPRFSALCYTFVTSGPKRKAPGLDIRGLFVPESLAGAGGFEPPATGFGDMCPGKHVGQCASIFSDF
jgi:hypothetical protein